MMHKRELRERRKKAESILNLYIAPDVKVSVNPGSGTITLRDITGKTRLTIEAVGDDHTCIEMTHRIRRKEYEI
jgi:hypothetical protein